MIAEIGSNVRGLAVGLTLQTSYVTAMSSIPLDNLPRGASLLNSTRFVVQAVSVAALATILVSYVSPQVKAEQQQLQAQPAAASVRFGVCETPGVPADSNLPPAAQVKLASMSPQAAAVAKVKLLGGLKLACDQTMRGFEAAYKITFFASIGALILAAFLPGWPGKWSGRGSTQAPPPGGH